MVKYIPQQGDIVYLDFNPQSGHEQAGCRPALVMSNHFFNRVTNFVVVCPISNSAKDFPLHIPLPSSLKTTGKLLCEHLKSVDGYSRNITFVEKVEDELLQEALDIVKGIFESV